MNRNQKTTTTTEIVLRKNDEEEKNEGKLTQSTSVVKIATSHCWIDSFDYFGWETWMLDSNTVILLSG